MSFDFHDPHKTFSRAECELSGVSKTAEDMADHIRKRVHGNEMDFTFNIPEPGEYLLKIFVVEETDERRQVCLYWLTDADHSKTREVGVRLQHLSLRYKGLVISTGEEFLCT